MKAIKYVIILISGLFVGSTLFAQEYMYEKHEFLIYGGGAMSSLNYISKEMNVNKGTGGQFGVGYNLFFSSSFGIGIGAEMSIYTSKALLDMLSEKYAARDRYNESFEFRSKVYNYQEEQRATYINIPLMLNFQSSGVNRFYIGLGAKVGLPVSGQYKTSGATFVNSGYYKFENVEYTTQEFMGFGSFTGKEVKGDLSFKTACFATAEMGVKLKLHGGLLLYTGIYAEYGFNNILKNKAVRDFVEYNVASSSNFKTNSVLASQFDLNGTRTTFVEKANLLSVGVKIKIAFGKMNNARTILL